MFTKWHKDIPLTFNVEVVLQMYAYIYIKQLNLTI